MEHIEDMGKSTEVGSSTMIWPRRSLVYASDLTLPVNGKDGMLWNLENTASWFQAATMLLILTKYKQNHIASSLKQT